MSEYGIEPADDQDDGVVASEALAIPLAFLLRSRADVGHYVLEEASDPEQDIYVRSTISLASI